jgi:hypothetical protein
MRMKSGGPGGKRHGRFLPAGDRSPSRAHPVVANKAGRRGAAVSKKNLCV